MTGIEELLILTVAALDLSVVARRIGANQFMPDPQFGSQMCIRDRAKNMQPIAKRCKALGISPAVMGYSKKETKRNPGGQMRKKKSEYAIPVSYTHLDVYKRQG